MIVVGALLIGGVGVGLALSLSDSDRRVVVVRVAANAPRAASKAAGAESREYPPAAGAPSLNSVRAALQATERDRRGGSAGSPAASGPLLTPEARASFAALAATLPGRVEVALAPLGAGPRELLGVDQAAHGWSTTKVPVLVALLSARGREGLTSQERHWARAAITESDNQSVLDLFGDLEQLEGGLNGASDYVDGLLRRSGDSETVVATAPPPPGAVTTFGQTEWSPGQAVKFFRALALGCLLPASATSYVLGLMQSIVPSESWGLGSAGLPSMAYKGGWGPESDGYLVRQSGIIDAGSSRGVAIAIVAFSPSFAAGTEMLTLSAAWLAHHLLLSQRPSAGCQGE